MNCVRLVGSPDFSRPQASHLLKQVWSLPVAAVSVRLFCFVCFFFSVTGVWTQSFTLTRQHSTTWAILLALEYFPDNLELFVQVGFEPWSSASWVARITGMSYWCLASEVCQRNRTNMYTCMYSIPVCSGPVMPKFTMLRSLISNVQTLHMSCALPPTYFTSSLDELIIPDAMKVVAILYCPGNKYACVLCRWNLFFQIFLICSWLYLWTGTQEYRGLIVHMHT
jgi:hypothetical protein